MQFIIVQEGNWLAFCRKTDRQLTFWGEKGMKHILFFVCVKDSVGKHLQWTRVLASYLDQELYIFKSDKCLLTSLY